MPQDRPQYRASAFRKTSVLAFGAARDAGDHEETAASLSECHLKSSCVLQLESMKSNFGVLEIAQVQLPAN